METKRCSKCKQELPLNHFYKDKSRLDKKTPYCKGCINKLNNENRFKKQGITPDTYKQLESDGCAICGKSHNNGKRFAIDRGSLLCDNCIKGIRFLRDNPKAVEYLQASLQETN